MKRLVAIPLAWAALIFGLLSYYGVMQAFDDFNQGCAPGWNICFRMKFLAMVQAIVLVPSMTLFCLGLLAMAIVVASGTGEEDNNGQS